MLIAVQILVFEGEWSVYEDTPPTPDHPLRLGVKPVLKIRVMKIGFQAAISQKGLLKFFLGNSWGNLVLKAPDASAAEGLGSEGLT